MVRVLRYLSEHGGHADSTEIRSGVPGYGDASGRRLWRRDIAELRRRGLVAPHRPGEQMSSRVELLPLMKPTDLFLTRSEHAVLTRVEDELRGDAMVPSPLDAEVRPEVRDLARLTRYLEERPGRSMTYGDVERATGLTEPQLTDLLRQIVDLDAPTYFYAERHPALTWIDYVPPDEEDPDGCVCSLDAAAELGAELERTFQPGERTGKLGFFAYSAAETDDRLQLINRALGELDLSPDERAQLVQARWKLDQWRTRLPD